MQNKLFLSFSILLILLMINCCEILFAQGAKNDDTPFTLDYFMGKWEGTNTGVSGSASVEREYTSILRGRYLQGISISVYDRQAKKPKGDVREQIDIFSYDKFRKKFVLRQFHLDGFVNHYTNDSVSADGMYLYFDSESIENIPDGWRARETYTILNQNEFKVVYEVAAPNQDFQVYSETTLKRKLN